ncbi:MAG: DUF4261 domain-containing protein [Janthinobacterium lividum]
MGLLDRLKKKEEKSEPEERLENVPEMLNVKLLFAEKPVIDSQVVLAELRKYYPSVDHPQEGKSLLFFFPEIEVQFTDGAIAAQCAVFLPDDKNINAEIKEEAFQQNWHWREAEVAARSCHYEVLLTDFMTRTLDYKTRFKLFVNFVAAVTKATKPQVVYAVTTQKLLEPGTLIEDWDSREKEDLSALVNVRLYNISDGRAGETLMDTVGLHQFGLPDFQIRFTDYNPSEIAGLLWNYAYYLFENGDVIENGNTLAGLGGDSKWRCDRQISLVGPERIVLDVQPV